MPASHVAIGAAVAVIWGVNFIAIHVGEETFPPLLFVALRFTFVAFPAVLFVPRPRVALRYVIGFGLFLSGATQGLLFVSIHVGMPAGLASLVVQSQAIFTVALAALALGERPARRQLAGAAIAAAGIALIGVDRLGGRVPVLAVLLCIGAAASWGVGNVIVRVARPPDAVSIVVWSSLVPPLPLLALSLALEGAHRDGHAVSSASAGAIASLAFVVVAATIVGSGAWTWLLRHHPASKVAPFSLLVPVFGIASAWVALSERPGAVELIGAAVVLAGLSLVTFSLRYPVGAVAPAASTATRSARRASSS